MPSQGHHATFNFQSNNVEPSFMRTPSWAAGQLCLTTGISSFRLEAYLYLQR